MTWWHVPTIQEFEGLEAPPISVPLHRRLQLGRPKHRHFLQERPTSLRLPHSLLPACSRILWEIASSQEQGVLWRLHDHNLWPEEDISLCFLHPHVPRLQHCLQGNETVPRFEPFKRKVWSPNWPSQVFLWRLPTAGSATVHSLKKEASPSSDSRNYWFKPHCCCSQPSSLQWDQRSKTWHQTVFVWRRFEGKDAKL